MRKQRWKVLSTKTENENEFENCNWIHDEHFNKCDAMRCNAMRLSHKWNNSDIKYTKTLSYQHDGMRWVVSVTWNEKLCMTTATIMTSGKYFNNTWNEIKWNVATRIGRSKQEWFTVKLGSPRILSIFTSAHCCLYEKCHFCFTLNACGGKGERIDCSQVASQESEWILCTSTGAWWWAILSWNCEFPLRWFMLRNGKIKFDLSDAIDNRKC